MSVEPARSPIIFKLCPAQTLLDAMWVEDMDPIRELF